MCGTIAVDAMEPLSAEQLARLSIQINTSDNAFKSNMTVGPEYTDESNPTTIKIQNFNKSFKELLYFNGKNESNQLFYKNLHTPRVMHSS